MLLSAKVFKVVNYDMKEREIPLRPICLQEIKNEPEAGEEVKEVKGEASLLKQMMEAEASAAALAAEIIEKAKQEAEKIKKEAEEGRKQALEQGLAQGEARGYREGLEKGAEEAEEIKREALAIRENAKQVLQQARKIHQETITAAEAKIIELAVAIAGKIIDREIELNPQIIIDISRKAIMQVASGMVYTIYANPESAELLHKSREELLAEAPPGARLQVITDTEFKAGECRVETENGFIDVNIDAQMEKIKEILRQG